MQSYYSVKETYSSSHVLYLEQRCLHWPWHWLLSRQIIWVGISHSTYLNYFCSANIVESLEMKKKANNNNDEQTEFNKSKSKKKFINDIMFKSKFEQLIEELKTIRDNKPQSKSLIFLQYFLTLQWMKQELPKHGFEFKTLSGDMSMPQHSKVL